MQLFRTGAFLRASRNARLNSQCIRSTLVSPPHSRWNSTSLKEFPTQQGRSSNSVLPMSGSGKAYSNTSAAQNTEELRLREAKNIFIEHLRTAAEEKQIITSESGLTGTRIYNQPIIFDDSTNVSPSILGLIGRKLYDEPNHPLCITRRLIESVFAYPMFKNHIATDPVVTTHDNFERLGFPADHPGRSKTDTYYVDSSRVLRTHTSAHQHAAFEYMSKNPEVGYTICADVYRRDSVDRSHFPVFHQMEGAQMWKLPDKEYPNETRTERLFRRVDQIVVDTESLPKHDLEIEDQAGAYNWETNPIQVTHDRKEVIMMGNHLKRSLETLVAKVFTAAREAGVGSDNLTEPLKVRWIEAYFPFTSPSWELEVWWQGEWLEILGCGITQQSILNNAGLPDHVGWAWGIGIERLAMILFGIPDIRLFWSKDSRFLDQFKEGKVTKFVPFSKYPACPKDLSFWLPVTSPTASPIAASPSSSAAPSNSGVATAAGGDSTKASSTSLTPNAFHENDLMEIVRDVAGTSAENVTLIDEFIHPKSGRKSLCYRINYRSLEKTLTTEEAMNMHHKVEQELLSKFEGVELR